jgi:putative transposase
MTGGEAMHRRRSVRLAGCDYSQPGMYFITVCTEGRAGVLGEVVGDRVRLSEAGRVAEDEWMRSARMRPGVMLDQICCDAQPYPRHRCVDG